jgi:hypothetical protein
LPLPLLFSLCLLVCEPAFSLDFTPPHFLLR